MLSEALPNSRAPSLHGHYPASSLLRARPPPSRRRPLSGRTGYTAYPAPPISRRGEEGFSSCLTCPTHRAVANTPPEGTRRVSQPATLPAAFAHEVSARPPESFVEAILTFTHVTARSLASIRPMVSSMGFRALVSRRPAIQATGRLAVAPVGLPPTEHVCLLWTHTSCTTTGHELTSRSRRMRRMGGQSSGRRWHDCTDS